MIERPISTIVPVLDTQGKVTMPLSWQTKGGPISCCIKLNRADAAELGERLIKLGREDGND